MTRGGCHATDCVERFAASVAAPRAASAYGVDYKELSHNALLATLAGSALGPAFVHALVVEATRGTGAPGAGTELLATLAEGPVGVKAVAANRSDGAGGRPDLRVDGTVGVRPFVLLLELKVQAPDGQTQLQDYVVQARNAGAEHVAGLLVRIPGTDASPVGDAPVLDGAAVARALTAALEATPVLDARVGWLARDYLETLRFLNLADHMAIHHADDLASSTDGVLGDWWNDNWRWVHERVARELGSEGRPLFTVLKDSYVNKDANGSFVDFWWKDRFWLARGPSGAGAFVKWRVGKGLEVHGLAEGYFGGEVTEPSYGILNALVARTRKELAPSWAERDVTYPNRGGKSRMIARLAQTSLSAAAALETMRHELPAIEAALDRAVTALEATELA